VSADPDLPPLREERFLDMVLALARLRSWRVAHFRPARTLRGWRTAVQGDGRGFPDAVLLRGPRMVVAELKVGKGKPTAEQLLWLAAFRLAGAESYCWKPEDWPLIERVLT
jgi:hypothetical protein